MPEYRIFPRRTAATPDDELVLVGEHRAATDAERVYISVAFTWDIPIAERLEQRWRKICPTEVGGPAVGSMGGDFVPGRFIKKGYVITSRGCPNKCWFCKVWYREGPVRELPITEGWNVLDDNLLACSVDHVRQVFDMLNMQDHDIVFTGGLEAARLEKWHVHGLYGLKPKRMFFAYDGPEDKEPLFEAGKMLLNIGFTRASCTLRAYVLIGYPGDTIDKATERLRDCCRAGFMPMAMLYRDQSGETTSEWRSFQRLYANHRIVYQTYKEFM